MLAVCFFTVSGDSTSRSAISLSDIRCASKASTSISRLVSVTAGPSDVGGLLRIGDSSQCKSGRLVQHGQDLPHETGSHSCICKRLKQTGQPLPAVC